MGWALLLLGFLAVWLAREVVLSVILAILLKFLLDPLVRALGRLRLPASLGAAVVIFGLLGTLGAAVYHLAGPASEWLERAPAGLREIRQKMEGVRGPVDRVQEAAQEVDDLTEATPRRREVVVEGESLLAALFEAATGFFGGLVVVLILTYFLLASGDLFLRKILRLHPRLSDKKRVVTIARRAERDVSRYLTTITLINLGLGGVSAAALWLLGMPVPLLWGALIAGLNYVPYLGAVANVVIIGVVAMLTFEDPGRALVVPLVSFGLTSLEGGFLTPLLLGKRLTLNPVVIFVALLFCVWLWNLPGALLAVPVLALLKIFADSVPGMAALGELLGRS